MKEWQPIATAPTYWTKVLVYDADTENVYIAQFENNATPPYWSYDTEDLTEEKAEIMQPTHWMPLPNPPVPAEGR